MGQAYRRRCTSEIPFPSCSVFQHLPHPQIGKKSVIVAFPKGEPMLEWSPTAKAGNKGIMMLEIHHCRGIKIVTALLIGKDLSPWEGNYISSLFHHCSVSIDALVLSELEMYIIIFSKIGFRGIRSKTIGHNFFCLLALQTHYWDIQSPNCSQIGSGVGCLWINAYILKKI